MSPTIECRCGWAGDVTGLAPPCRGASILACPRCRKKTRLSGGLFEKAYSTCRKTSGDHKFRSFVSYLPRERVSPMPGRWLAFTDGSTSGSYAAVVIQGGFGWSETIDRVRHPAPTPSRNVTAEIMGVALALRFLPERAHVTVVSDYFGTSGWLSGQWKLGSPWLTRRVGLIAMLIRDKRLRVVFVHHRGHQKDESLCTTMNNRADRLCWTRPDLKNKKTPPEPIGRVVSDSCCERFPPCSDCPRDSV